MLAGLAVHGSSGGTKLGLGHFELGFGKIHSAVAFSKVEGDDSSAGVGGIGKTPR